MKKGLKFILRKLFWGFSRHLLSDKNYAKVRYWIELDEWPRIDNPQKFTEKIQYIKLYEQSEMRKKAANRLKVRDYVEKKIGGKYLIPLHDVFETLSEERWKSLPKQFVLKANHGSQMIKIVHAKNEEDYSEIYKVTEEWKRFDYAKFGRERIYEDVQRILLTEKLLMDSEGEIPNDYKFFCFHGKVELIQIDFGRFGEHTRKFLDSDFKEIDTKVLYPTYIGHVKKPANLDEAIEVAEKLSSEFNFIRVDLYLLDESIYFGELTNYPGNGFQPFEPESMEYKIGAKLNL